MSYKKNYMLFNLFWINICRIRNIYLSFNIKRHIDTRVIFRCASSLSSSIGTWSVCEDVDASENRGWPRPSIGKGKRGGDLSANVPEQGMTVSAVVAECRKRLLLQHSERGKYFHTNPTARVGDFIFNTKPQWPGEIAGDWTTLTTKFDVGRPMSCPCCCGTFSLQLMSIVVLATKFESPVCVLWGGV